MKDLLLLSLTFIFIILMVVISGAVVAKNKDHQYWQDVYYEPQPQIQTQYTECINGKQEYTVAAWYGRFEPEGREVFVCTPDLECEDQAVPENGKWYKYFRWYTRERQCWY